MWEDAQATKRHQGWVQGTDQLRFQPTAGVSRQTRECSRSQLIPAPSLFNSAPAAVPTTTSDTVEQKRAVPSLPCEPLTCRVCGRKDLVVLDRELGCLSCSVGSWDTEDTPRGSPGRGLGLSATSTSGPPPCPAGHPQLSPPLRERAKRHLSKLAPGV